MYGNEIIFQQGAVKMSQNKAFSTPFIWLFFVFTSAISCTALVLLRLPKT